MQFNRLISLRDLAEDFGAGTGSPETLARTERDLIGESYRDLLEEMAQLVTYQWANGLRRGAVKGFFLAGPPGVGKTTLARRLAYELGLRFGPAMPGVSGGVTLALVDGSDIARARYGESEGRIQEVFSWAEKGFSSPGERSVLLFDDVECILMARESGSVKEWHLSQDSVFFHAVDALDTSRAVVVLTSNRPDLVDEAILDRFLRYDVPAPSASLLARIAERQVQQQGLDPAAVSRIARIVEAAANEGRVRSVRDAQRLALRSQVEQVLGRGSRARLEGAAPAP